MSGPFDIGIPDSPLSGQDPFEDPPAFPEVLEGESAPKEGANANKVEGPRTSRKRDFFEPTRDERAHPGVDVNAEELLAVSADYIDELDNGN